jgi:hypothetical protein
VKSQFHPSRKIFNFRGKELEKQNSVTEPNNGEERPSLTQRLRPSLQGLVQDILGPASLLDETLGGKPIFPKNEFEPEEELLETEQSDHN